MISKFNMTINTINFPLLLVLIFWKIVMQDVKI